jgi:acetyltransferase-like isoleucine patch superfamily enzyme
MNSFVEFTGTARLDRRTKHLVRRLGPDDIAIIDHTDLDRVSAEELLESGVRVVINVSPSQTGRFPNPGPLTLVRGGVRLIDAPGADLFDRVHDGDWLTVRGSMLFSNGTQLAGHVTVDEKAILSGLVAVHQFATIGRFSFIGGCSRVAKDVPPYVKAVGNPVKLYGLNSVGLERNGFPEDVRRELKRAYRLFFKSELNLSQARERATAELQPFPEIQEFLAFFDRSDRGSVVG